MCQEIKLTVKQKFCASSWLITEINILRCTVSKTSKVRSVTNSFGDFYKAVDNEQRPKCKF